MCYDESKDAVEKIEAEDENGLDDSEAERSIGGHDYHRDCGGITGVWKLPVHHPL